MSLKVHVENSPFHNIRSRARTLFKFIKRSLIQFKLHGSALHGCAKVFDGGGGASAHPENF